MTTNGQLVTEIRVGNSVYPPGTPVRVFDSVYIGTRDECTYVKFPHGEGTYLTDLDVQRSN